MGISPFHLVEVSEKAKRGHLRCTRRKPMSILMMKKRGRVESSRRVRRKVKTLKKLIPNKESMGLDGLFKETAEYIMCLQMRVKVMQVMVKVLTGSSDE